MITGAFKKAVLFFFALQFLSGGMLEKEMSKWDGYWRHFQYHKHRNSEYTFSRFVYVHFLDGEHNKWRENRHRSTPFKKRTFTSSPIIKFFAYFNPKEIFLKVEDMVFVSLPTTYILPFVSNALIKPPTF